MMFNKGKGRFSDPKHIRRARAYLEEARMAMLEHSIAAEHYQAMTAMYAQRVQRLERDIAAWEAAEAAPAQSQRLVVGSGRARAGRGHQAARWQLGHRHAHAGRRAATRSTPCGVASLGLGARNPSIGD